VINAVKNAQKKMKKFYVVKSQNNVKLNMEQSGVSLNQLALYKLAR